MIDDPVVSALSRNNEEELQLEDARRQFNGHFTGTMEGVEIDIAEPHDDTPGTLILV